MKNQPLVKLLAAARPAPELTPAEFANVVELIELLATIDARRRKAVRKAS